MKWRQEWKILFWLSVGFLVMFFLPVGEPRFNNAVFEALELARWYAREHVLLCLVPAFYIAGAIAVFVSQNSVMKYLGPAANKVLAYGVASVSGTILAVCSCTVLPLFAGIYRMGAGLGPAIAFLYSGPAINVLAIILTARVLGMQLGVGRAVGAIVFSIVIGLLMHLFFRSEEQEKMATLAAMPVEDGGRPLWKTALHFFAMVAILIFGTWSGQSDTGFFHAIYQIKWPLAGAGGLGLGIILITWFGFTWWRLAAVGVAVVALSMVSGISPLIPFTVGTVGLGVAANFEKGENREWLEQTWGFTKQILPLLLAGVLVSGLLLGRPGHEGLIPAQWVAGLVGGNSLSANFFAAISGAFMYFATLTEVPILQGLLGNGMGQGPALSLLLAGPAVSLPSILVLRSIMGDKKTAIYIILVVIMATITGLIFGTFFA